MSGRIIDMHQHLAGCEHRADELAEECERLGIVKSVLLALPPSRVRGDNEQVLAAAKKYPDLFVPFVGLEMDEATPDDLTRFRDQGFRGIKFIAPTCPYSDKRYFTLYERAQSLAMPGLFHLGIVMNTQRWQGVDNNLMRPIHLEFIARNLPEWKIIGAHLGNPWYEEATMSCRWNPNLFFDLSGSTLKKKTPEFLGSLLWWTQDTAYKSPDRTCAWEKIVFGSDVAASDVSDVVNDYEKVMTDLNLDASLREAIWYGTGAKILGLSET